MPNALLQVSHLRVEFPTRHGVLTAVDDVSFDIAPGEVLGVVGESGAGKSLTGNAVIGLLEPPGRIAGGEIHLEGQRIDRLPLQEMRHVRGRRIGSVFQDPLTSLNPLYTIGQQLTETIQVHLGLSANDARRRAVELLQEVGIAAPEQRFDQYPHEFSGGMRQRVVIALALCANPRLIVADEPTTALDVSIQAQIIAVLKRLTREHDTAVMLITHDMGVIAEIADRVAVMYAGRIIEIGPTREMINSPRHPYTMGLMGSIPSIKEDVVRLVQIDGAMPRLDAIPAGCAFNPRCPSAFDRCRSERPPLIHVGAMGVACWLYDSSIDTKPNLPSFEPVRARDVQPTEPSLMNIEQPLLELRDVVCHYDVSSPWLNRRIDHRPRQMVKAVDGVSFALRRGETMALVGESGCGKSTVARLIVGLSRLNGGTIAFDGANFATLKSRADWAPLRRRMQMIFQDPYASLNPRWRAADIIAEPIRLYGLAKDEALQRRVDELLVHAGLSPRDGEKYPHEFSGGQRQRVSVARALAGEPDFLICDEPTSALAISTQAQILNLMKDLQERHKLTYLFISHNLAIVRYLADRVAVMYLGRIVEMAPTATLFSRPQHPYTRMLLDAVPDVEMVGRARMPVAGEIPNPLAPPSGCAFHPRCPLANGRCKTEVPMLKTVPSGSDAACHAVEEGR